MGRRRHPEETPGAASATVGRCTSSNGPTIRALARLRWGLGTAHSRALLVPIQGFRQLGAWRSSEVMHCKNTEAAICMCKRDPSQRHPASTRCSKRSQFASAAFCGQGCSGCRKSCADDVFPTERLSGRQSKRCKMAPTRGLVLDMVERAQQKQFGGWSA